MNPVDEYINNQPRDIRPILNQVRELILRMAPEAQEHISYAMPAYKLNGKPLVYFAAQKKHLGLYATPSGHEKFAEQLSAYKQGKGSVQFPFNKPIPYDLIEDIVEFRVQENRAAAEK
jgi:uncharacterized protein YdhG (YjbR/CyaY superfamily)